MSEHEDDVLKGAADRHQGMDEDRKEELQEHLEQLNDWYATCPRCGVHCTGTIAQLKAHVCHNQ